METGEIKSKLSWKLQKISVSGTVLSTLCGSAHLISQENPETWTINTIYRVGRQGPERLTRCSGSC